MLPEEEMLWLFTFFLQCFFPFLQGIFYFGVKIILLSASAFKYYYIRNKIVLYGNTTEPKGYKVFDGKTEYAGTSILSFSCNAF